MRQQPERALAWPWFAGCAVASAFVRDGVSRSRSLRLGCNLRFISRKPVVSKIAPVRLLCFGLVNNGHENKKRQTIKPQKSHPKNFSRGSNHLDWTESLTSGPSFSRRKNAGKVSACVVGVASPSPGQRGGRRGGGRSSRGFFPAPRAKASGFGGTRELLQLLRPSLGSLGVCLTLPLRRLPRPSAGPGLALRPSAWAPSGHFSLSRSAFIFSLLRYFQSPRSRQGTRG